MPSLNKSAIDRSLLESIRNLAVEAYRLADTAIYYKDAGDEATYRELMGLYRQVAGVGNLVSIIRSELPKEA